MNSITIYQFESPEIKISMQLYFNAKNQLIFEGTDIGKRVAELTGDSDYEYFYTIEPTEVQKLADLLQINPGDRSALLLALKEKFHGNDAYSKFGEFMKSHQVLYSPYSW